MVLFGVTCPSWDPVLFWFERWEVKKPCQTDLEQTRASLNGTHILGLIKKLQMYVWVILRDFPKVIVHFLGVGNIITPALNSKLLVIIYLVGETKLTWSDWLSESTSFATARVFSLPFGRLR